MLETAAFALVIADIFMPGMDGIETVRALRLRQPSLPIIVVSGGGSHFRALQASEFLTAALEFGATAVLQKPFKPRQLLETIRSCLDGTAQPEAADIERPDAEGDLRGLSR